jgi:hypothetical protein
MKRLSGPIVVALYLACGWACSRGDDGQREKSVRTLATSEQAPALTAKSDAGPLELAASSTPRKYSQTMYCAGGAGQLVGRRELRKDGTCPDGFRRSGEACVDYCFHFMSWAVTYLTRTYPNDQCSRPGGDAFASVKVKDPWGTVVKVKCLDGWLHMVSAGPDREWDSGDDILAAQKPRAIR